jgi:hypothetical protein
MSIEKNLNEIIEREIILLEEHIFEMEGIFWDNFEKRDAKQLVGLYGKYLEKVGINENSLKIFNKRNDFKEYLSKMNGSREKYFQILEKRWKLKK